MKLEISDRQIKIGIVVMVILIVIMFAVVRYRSRSNFEWPVPNTSVKADKDAAGTLTSDLQSLQDTYNLSMIAVNVMTDPVAKQAATLAAQTTLSTGINNRIATYVRGKCSDVTSGVAPTAADKIPFWNTYQSDLAKIQQAYYTIIGSATATSTPSSPQIIAARKADISGATRKYIASICPAFYKTTTTDPTADYITWTYVESGTLPATAKSGLIKDDVTNPNVTTWAGYAALTKSVAATISVSSGATTVGSATAPLTAVDWSGFAVGDSVQYTYQTVDAATGVTTTSRPVMGTVATLATTNLTITPAVAVPATGYIIPAGTVIAKAFVSGSTTWNKLDADGVPNWKKARDAGPGTSPKPVWGTL